MHVETEPTADEGNSAVFTAEEVECCQVVDSDSLLPERPNVLINSLTAIEVADLPIKSEYSFRGRSPMFLSGPGPPLKLLGQLRI